MAGTPVHTQDGLKPIEDIQVGDLVKSKDELSGETTWKPVTELFRNDDKEILNVVLVNAEGEEEALGTTHEHPFWVENKGWVEAKDLQPGDIVTGVNGTALTVRSTVAEKELQDTYNFEVEDFHTYFVGEQGAWVHNVCIPKPPRGPSSTPPSERDPKRLFSPKEREKKRKEQNDKCPMCGKDIDADNSNGHHIDRHADGGKTTPDNHVELCKDCHKDIHSKGE